MTTCNGLSVIITNVSQINMALDSRIGSYVLFQVAVDNSSESCFMDAKRLNYLILSIFFTLN